MTGYILRIFQVTLFGEVGWTIPSAAHNIHNCQDPRTIFLHPLFQNKEGTTEWKVEATGPLQLKFQRDTGQ